ncbi:hypothetical protein ACLB2K_026706 [Fragaria x ananassa]
MWFLHSSFKDVVAICWTAIKPARCPMYVTLQKLKALKLCLKQWNNTVFGNVHRNLELVRAKLSAIQQDIASNSSNDINFEAEVMAKVEVLQAVKRQEAFRRDRARVKWVIPSLVSEEDNLLLASIPTSEEIRRAFFSMDPSSAPSPDGFPGSFYRSCWDTVGADVISFVQFFFQQNWLYPNANSNFILLIPKIEGANVISQFRPIALANFLFKVIPKIMADRLGPIALRIISPHQAAFLKGRRIADCISLVYEGFNLLDKKSYGGNVGIEVDIAKAFDTLNWEFLFEVLAHFGFSSRFRNLIQTILQSARLSVLINGTPHGFFSCDRGVRQGDPLSPLLFCIAEEALSRGLSSLFSARKIKPIAMPRRCLCG